MADNIYIGVDLGGTSIKVGICDEKGKLLNHMEGPTESEGGPEVVIKHIADYVREIVASSSYHWDQVAGIGAGITGFLDIEQGIVKLSGNLGWHDVPVKKMLEEHLG